MKKPTTQAPYDKLQALSKKAQLLASLNRLAEWDHETMMPMGAEKSRGEQLKVIAGCIHEIKTSKEYGNALKALIDLKTGAFKDSSLSADQKACLKAWARDYKIDTSLPQEFVEENAKLVAESISAWRTARHDNNFKAFLPLLTKTIEMAKKKAELVGYEESPYDALLDIYEPGMTSAKVQSLFDPLKANNTALLKTLLKNKQPAPIDGHYPEGKQMEFCKVVLNQMGYPFDKSRLDVSTHPFSTSFHPTDCRITTRFDVKDGVGSILTTLHEAGHSFYELGLPEKHFGNPLCESVSLGIHESQSRFWETRIGMSKPFWKHFFPKLQKTFPKQLDHLSLDEFYKSLNLVKPTCIRVEADEVTYPLHVILRFELERALIEGKLKPRDIPEAWNAKMKELLGITPKNDAEGCLQDIHWAMGGIGYFPTYALGNLYAAQLFETFEQDHPDWQKRTAKGELAFIRDWLENKIYKHGRKYEPMELIKKATGKPFSAEAYNKYLKGKYPV